MTTFYYFLAFAWEISMKNNDTIHIMLYGIAIAMSDAMVLVLSIYWGNGANSFAENPVLMILNHSYVIFLMPFEIALSGIAIEAKHYFIFFLPQPPRLRPGLQPLGYLSFCLPVL